MTLPQLIEMAQEQEINLVACTMTMDLLPFVININEATKQNNTYRTAIWTGDNLQVTLMSLNPGEDIGLEMHPFLMHSIPKMCGRFERIPLQPISGIGR